MSKSEIFQAILARLAQYSRARNQVLTLVGRDKFIEAALVADELERLEEALRQLQWQWQDALPELWLISYGSKKISCIKEVRQATGLSLKAAKELVESCPCWIRTDEPYDLRHKLEGYGAEVDLRD